VCQTVTIWVKLVHVPLDDKARQHLADAVKTRQRELGMTQRRIVKRMGISEETLRMALRQGTLSEDTKRAIERGLAWPRGATEEALTGKQPTPLDPPNPQDQLPPPSPWAEHAIVVRPDLIKSKTGEEIQAAVDMVKAVWGEQKAADLLDVLFKVRNESPPED
jgi:transcriptional regulator with XRE-family HTH domain